MMHTRAPLEYKQGITPPPFLQIHRGDLGPPRSGARSALFLTSFYHTPRSHFRNPDSYSHLLKIRGWPSRLQRLPTPASTIRACPPHRRYRYHICICTPHRSPGRHRSAPSNRLLPCAPSRPVWSVPGRAGASPGERARSRDSVGSWYVGSRSRGSSGCPGERGGPRLRENESVRLPTSHVSICLVLGIRGIAYSLHPESSATIHHLEEIFVFFAPEEAELGNFEIRPEMAHVVLLALHCLWVNVWERCVAWIAAQNFFRQGAFEVRIVFWEILGLVLLRLDEHFPQTLRL